MQDGAGKGKTTLKIDGDKFFPLFSVNQPLIIQLLNYSTNLGSEEIGSESMIEESRRRIRISRRC